MWVGSGVEDSLKKLETGRRFWKVEAGIKARPGGRAFRLVLEALLLCPGAQWPLSEPAFLFLRHWGESGLVLGHPEDPSVWDD